MRWGHPCQYRAISQAALLAQVLPRSRFQGSQDMGATLTNMLDEAARDETCVYQHQHVGSYLREQAVRPMHFRNIVTVHLQSNDCMAATLGQQHTLHLWIGTGSILVATAAKGCRVGCCISGV